MELENGFTYSHDSEYYFSPDPNPNIHTSHTPSNHIHTSFFADNHINKSHVHNSTIHSSQVPNNHIHRRFEDESTAQVSEKKRLLNDQWYNGLKSTSKPALVCFKQ
ncbi:hypothetical protein YC2023_081383 [Brassica napus]